MENLLRNDFTAYYGLPTCTESGLIIETAVAYFEIEDTDEKEIMIHTVKGQGIARFSNSAALTITIANYDKFVTALPYNFQNGKKRCDIALVSDSHFILGELKNKKVINSRKRNKVRKEAKEQLLESLTMLIAVPQILTLINSKTVKKCCYFNKKAEAPALITAITAFNRLSTIPNSQDGYQMEQPAIEAHNFEYWEYLGEQTLTLS